MSTSPIFILYDGEAIDLEEICYVSLPYINGDRLKYYCLSKRTNNKMFEDVQLPSQNNEKRSQRVKEVKEHRKKLIQAWSDYKSGVMLANLIEQEIAKNE
jgi:hypothetical protein